MGSKAKETASLAVKKVRRTQRKIRWAFIGCGGISQAHISAIKEIPEIEIVGGSDLLVDRLEKFTELTGCKAVYTDYKKMLAALKPDAVDVCTPNGVHMPATIAALNAGCHVITEKPMAMNPDECEAMIAAAKKNGKLLCCGFQMRYHPYCTLFRKALEAGDIGDILYAKVHALRRRGVPNWGVFGQKALQGGGPMIDIGVHMIEGAHYCMGAPKPVAASGNCWTFLGDRKSEVFSIWPNWDYKTYTVEDLAVGQVRFANGALMQIESSFCTHIAEDVNYFEIQGTKGGFNFKTGELYTDHAGAMYNCHPAFIPSVEFGAFFVAKLKNFADAILKGTPLTSPAEDGYTVQKIIDGIYRSAALKGKEVAIR